MQSTRRKIVQQLATLFGASAVAGQFRLSLAQQSSEPSIEQYLSDPLLQPVSVKDFEPLAKAKLDPLAYDYLVGGSEDEVSLRDNRSGFDRIIIRPKALVDVHKIDLSVEIFGQKWSHPLFLCPAGGKNCFYPDGENVDARAAASAKTLQITSGGILRSEERRVGKECRARRSPYQNNEKEQ